MTRIKPPCPTCNKREDVRTLGGGSKEMYRYTCDSSICDGITWQQIPPHLIKYGDSATPTICKTNKKRGGTYLCGKCGLPKRNHKCAVQSRNADSEQKLKDARLLLNHSLTEESKTPSSALDDTFSLGPLVAQQQQQQQSQPQTQSDRSSTTQDVSLKNVTDNMTTDNMTTTPKSIQSQTLTSSTTETSTETSTCSSSITLQSGETIKMPFSNFDVGEL
tara:strand:- start:92 stop:748 length:657 start_codon:yes stop_codon:yes gene_type:complete